jgi:hypothetical protein
MSVMDGYLLKRGQMSTAKRRYFVLDPMSLSYYGSKEEPGPRSQLMLDVDTRVTEIGGRRGKPPELNPCGSSASLGLTARSLAAVA